jgi:undecaprenyl-diphosphatase
LTLPTGIILGLVQGLTEFLPVSSSGHLVLMQHFLKVPEASVAFDVFLHLATLLAAVLALRPELVRILAFIASTLGIRWVALRSDDLREGKRLFVALVVGTLPVAVAGIFFRDRIESYFANPQFVGVALLFTGVVLVSTHFASKRGGQLDTLGALAIGLAQAVALLPGVSRSGMTVSAGLFARVRRERAVRFSFLLSLPAVAGAGILKLRHGVEFAGVAPLTLAAAFVAALVSGYLATQILLRVVVSGRLSLFGFYCILAGVTALVLLSRTQ